MLNVMQKSSKEQLRSILEPRSVAVIGASSKSGKIGHEILKNIVEGGYAGPIYPVNPHEEFILALKSFKSIMDVPDDVDACIITVPPHLVAQVLDECGKKKVGGAVIISAGFSEIGNFDLERLIVEIASKNELRIVGPNCAGIINTQNKLYATMESRIGPGNIAFMTQSGALGGAALAWARQERIGISKFISYGNRCDIDEADILEYLVEDDQTKVIAAYIEGLRNGRRFLDSAKDASKKKPVVAIKSGTSCEGSRAALSHTGSLSGSDRVYDGAFLQTGIIRAEEIDDLFDMSKALSCQPASRGKRIAILTKSGGPSVMMTDALVKLNLEVPEPSTQMKDALTFLPEICSRKNPIDLTAEATPEQYGKVLETIAESNEYDIAISMFVPPAFVKSEETGRAVAEVASDMSKPIVACWMSGDLVTEAVQILEGRHVPNFPTPRRTAKAVWALVERGTYLSKSRSDLS
jgi:acetyl coenzyme A synthetase (ADP forming)-like protein